MKASFALRPCQHKPAFDGLRNWKNQRNTIFKDMQDVHVQKARLERLVTEGVRLLKELNKAAYHKLFTISSDSRPLEI